MKAPTTSDMEKAAPLLINMAAPAVDQAVTTGMRYRQDSATQVTPMPSPKAHIQEAAWAGVAPQVYAA